MLHLELQNADVSIYGYEQGEPTVWALQRHHPISVDRARGAESCRPTFSKCIVGGTQCEDTHRFSFSNIQNPAAPPRVPQRRPSLHRSRSVDYKITENKCTPTRSSLKREGAPRRPSIQIKGEVEIFLPGQRDPVRRKRSISFANEEDVKEVIPCHALSRSSEELWYKRHELRRIRKMNQKLVERMESFENERKLCIRGLEDMLINDDSDSRLDKQARESVLYLQDLQAKTGYYDCEYMARLYSHFTRESMLIANERARADANDICSYVRNVRNGSMDVLRAQLFPSSI